MSVITTKEKNEAGKEKKICPCKYGVWQGIIL